MKKMFVLLSLVFVCFTASAVKVSFRLLDDRVPKTITCDEFSSSESDKDKDFLCLSYKNKDERDKQLLYLLSLTDEIVTGFAHVKQDKKTYKIALYVYEDSIIQQ